MFAVAELELLAPGKGFRDIHVNVLRRLQVGRIRVHRMACISAKVMTSQGPVSPRVARETSQADKRGKAILRRRRAVLGTEEAIDITQRLARFWPLWNQLGVNKTL